MASAAAVSASFCQEVVNAEAADPCQPSRPSLVSCVARRSSAVMTSVMAGTYVDNRAASACKPWMSPPIQSKANGARERGALAGGAGLPTCLPFRLAGGGDGGGHTSRDAERCGRSGPVETARQESVLLTDLLTRLGGTGETTRETGDTHGTLRLVSETHLHTGDARDGRRGTHNPEVAGSNPAPATIFAGQRPLPVLGGAF